MYKQIEQIASKNTGPVVKILIMCGNEAYMKKITTDWIRRLYPNNKLEIINVGEYFFMLGETTTWPTSIPRLYDLIMVEFCPKDLFTRQNLEFLRNKMKKKGVIFFLFSKHRLFAKQPFKQFIQTKFDHRTTSLGFQAFDPTP